MKLNDNFQVPINAPQEISRFLYDVLRPMSKKVNGMAGGRFSDTDGVSSASPTAGMYAVGDFIRNSSPSELGSGGSKYVIFGWLCLTGGSPGTWVECRFLTGN